MYSSSMDTAVKFVPQPISMSSACAPPKGPRGGIEHVVGAGHHRDLRQFGQRTWRWADQLMIQRINPPRSTSRPNA
jgi:hypothetical protein